jgi:tetratricopeptide (TPR) repeat protein
VLSHSQRALDLYRSAGHILGQARALNGIGWSHTLLGEHQEALAYCQQALTLHREIGDRHGEADTWDSLGYIHHQLGQHIEAATYYQHAVNLFRELGNRYDQAVTLIRLGDAHHAADSDGAAHAWRLALDILDEMGHADAEQVRARLHTLAAVR